MAPPLSAFLITIFGLLAREINADSSFALMFLWFGGLVLYCSISLVITLIYVSNAGFLPLGGVHPVGMRKGSLINVGESLNQCCNRKRLLNSRVSRCLIISSQEEGCGQKDSPRLNSTFSSSDRLWSERLITAF